MRVFADLEMESLVFNTCLVYAAVLRHYCTECQDSLDIQQENKDKNDKCITMSGSKTGLSSQAELITLLKQGKSSIMVTKQLLSKDSEEKGRGPQYPASESPVCLNDGPMRKTGAKVEPSPQSII